MSLNRCDRCGSDKEPGKRCWPCAKAYNRRYYEANKHKWNMSHEQNRNAFYKWRYKITLEEYEVLLQKQNGVCLLCGEVCKTGRRLAVDHDHATGRVRGLLCRNCNQFVGRIEKNQELVKKIVEYIGCR